MIRHHLRHAALADALTAGTLALCGALGKPTNEDDRPKNIAWSIRLLSKYEEYGNPEFAALCGHVYAEARALDMAVSAEDQVRVCDVLASVFAGVFLAIRYIAAAYLLYLAWKLWNAPARPVSLAEASPDGPLRLFLAGLAI